MKEKTKEKLTGWLGTALFIVSIPLFAMGVLDNPPKVPLYINWATFFTLWVAMLAIDRATDRNELKKKRTDKEDELQQ